MTDEEKAKVEAFVLSIAMKAPLKFRQSMVGVFADECFDAEIHAYGYTNV
jgi:hypothetical protein